MINNADIAELYYDTLCETCQIDLANKELNDIDDCKVNCNSKECLNNDK